MRALLSKLTIGLALLACLGRMVTPAAAQNGGTAFLIPNNGIGPIYGAGGITVTSNGTTYTISGAGISSSTGGVSAATATNIVLSILGTNAVLTNLYVTNQCYTGAQLNTNILIMSAAGTAGANGIYNWNGTSRFTNGQAFLFFDVPNLLWVISNSASGVLYSSLDPAPSLWDTTVNGIAPPPTGVYGDITNCFMSIVAIIPLGLPLVSTNIFVSETLGNDTNAIRGRIDRKYKTIDRAVNDATSGDTIYLDPGDYPFTSARIRVPANVRIVGSGRGLTRLGAVGAPEERLQLRSQCILENLTFYGAVNYGEGAPDAASAPVTNCIIADCDIIGISDAVEADVFHSIRIENCLLVSTYDGIADWDLRPGGSNRVITVVNTRIVVTNGAFPVLHGINMGDSKIEMFGGSIEVYNGVNDNNCVFAGVETFRTNKSGSLLLSNVRLRSATTNGAYPSFVTNFSAIPIFMDNCTLERITPFGLVNNNFTNGWSDRLVTFTNTIQATNWLVDTRSLTNALTQASEQGFRVTICDCGFNAASSNLWIATRGNQKILASGLTTGPTITNLNVAGECLTLQIVGTNWQVVNVATMGTGDSTNHIVEAFGDVTLTNTLTQLGGGVSLSLAGGIKSSGIAMNLIDSDDRNRMVIARGGNSGNISFNGTNGAAAVVIGKDGAVTNMVSLTMSNVTASRPAIFDANRLLTNAAGTPDGTKFLRDDGVLAVPSGSAAGAVTNVVNASTNPIAGIVGLLGPTNNGDVRVKTISAGTNTVVTDQGTNVTVSTSIGLQSLTNVSIVNASSGDVLQFASDSKWHNFQPFYQVVQNIFFVSNVFIGVGTNIEQSIAIRTTNSFGLTFGGTPMPGERFHVAVLNANLTNDINMTNSSFDPRVGSNVLVYAIPSNSISSFTFINRTNWNTAGTNRWELDTYIQEEVELALAGGLVFVTNSARSIITISNSAVATFTISTNAPGMNARATNGTDIVLITSGIALTPTLTELAQVSLVVGDSNTYTVKIGSGLATTDEDQLQAVLPANCPYYFTNQSVGAATASIVSNHFSIVNFPGGVGNTGSGGAGMASLEVQTNGVRVGLITNINVITPGWTGAVSASTATLGSTLPNYQQFTNDGTWTKPKGATFIEVVCIGGGGGGGGGTNGQTNIVIAGGAGGGGASFVSKRFAASDVTDTVAITIGTNGVGGARGVTGSVGGNSTFGIYVTGYGGGGGGYGLTNISGSIAGIAGGGGAGTEGPGATGGNANSVCLGGSPANQAIGTIGGTNATGGSGASTASGSLQVGGCTGYGEYGGGAGGGTTTAVALGCSGGCSLYGAAGGGSGGMIWSLGTNVLARSGGAASSTLLGGGGTNGVAGSASPGGDGSAGSSVKCGAGGGGGAPNNATAGNGGNGGSGGWPGGGGGGGGASNGGTGGTGGNGCYGAVRIYSW